ncbi:MAG: hypothetical protein GXY58_09330 [Planctomycetaceae bacterium]|nr:hypothetical protein [Planctomycetaceae bacterium]
MNANPFLSVFFHWLGGLASASFYIPYRGVRKWSWETYLLVGSFFSWIIARRCWPGCWFPSDWPCSSPRPWSLAMATSVRWTRSRRRTGRKWLR